MSSLLSRNICQQFVRVLSTNLYSSNTNKKLMMNRTTESCEKCLIKTQTRCQHNAPNGTRQVFKGHKEEPMFEMESNVHLPKLEEGEVLVKVRAATICISDIHTVCGTRIEPTPSVLGHEACVEIVDHRRDPSLFDLKIGDRATFSIADSCGECEFCLNDLSQKCVKLFKYGHAPMNNGTGFNGCYATHIVLRKGTSIIKIPDEICDNLAASINCALATMVNCVSQIPPNVKRMANKALIQGDGMLGLYGCALLKQHGFKEVYCSGHQAGRSDLIKRFDAIPVSSDLKELKDEMNKIDCIIEVCGNPEVVPSGIKLLKPGGAYIFAGMVHPNSKLDFTGEQLIRKCLTIKGVHNYEAIHLQKSVEFLKKTINLYPYNELVASKIYNLEQLNEALETAKLKIYPRICIRP